MSRWERTSFIFYKSFRDQIEMIPTESQLEAFKAIVDYALFGVEYSGDDHSVKLIMYGAQPLILENHKKYLGGKKGGAPKGNKNAKKKAKKKAGYADADVDADDNADVDVDVDVYVYGEKQPVNNLQTTNEQPVNNQTDTETGFYHDWGNDPDAY